MFFFPFGYLTIHDTRLISDGCMHLVVTCLYDASAALHHLSSERMRHISQSHSYYFLSLIISNSGYPLTVFIYLDKFLNVKCEVIMNYRVFVTDRKLWVKCFLIGYPLVLFCPSIPLTDYTNVVGESLYHSLLSNLGQDSSTNILQGVG